MAEHPLRGGSVNIVVRVGDTVRRPPSGRRIHDVAHVCWQYLGLGPGADAGRAALREVRAAFRWVAEHRSELEVS